LHSKNKNKWSKNASANLITKLSCDMSKNQNREFPSETKSYFSAALTVVYISNCGDDVHCILTHWKNTATCTSGGEKKQL